MLTVKKSPKLRLDRGISEIDVSLEAHTIPRWIKQHKQETIAKLLQLSDKHSLGLQLSVVGGRTGGEGVEQQPWPRNQDQLQPTGNFLQCPSSEVVNTGSGEQYNGPTWTKAEMGQGGSQTTGGIADTVKVEIGAPEAKEGPPLTSGSPRPTDTETPVLTDPKWPVEAKVKITGYCPNPRLCVGKLIEGDRLGRVVSVWKGRMHFRTDRILPCKLDHVQGDDARYMPV